ncbi:MAG TPA: hypothetical protein ENJ18_01050 [Nannocystis exedens]|nr:hypothetical protein [Nannocystis exedens]
MIRTSLTILALTLSVGACAGSHKHTAPSDFAAGNPEYSEGYAGGSSYDASATGSDRGPVDGASGSATATAVAPAAQESTAAESVARGDASVGGASVSDTAPAPRRTSPGLGTAYGETRYSKVHTVPFYRSSDNPDVVLSLRYNDPQGIAALSSVRGGARSPQATMHRNSLQVSLLGEHGGVLPGAEIGGQVYAVGGIGQRYMIAIENHTTERYEVLASVDGLDVIDGSDASFRKRGYVVDPYTSFVIEGWRTGDETVAAFRFSALEESYAAQTGRPRNVGVVGVAFFQEHRPIDTRELDRRDSADPFPHRYTPPPPYRRY